MIIKVVSLALVLAALAHQGHGHGYSSQHIMMHHGKHVPIHYKHGKKLHHDFYAHPKYKYEYNVKDKHTGDEKSHHETRHGDVVKGSYTFHEPDGRLRVVKYTADKHTGFHASVEHEGKAKHVIPKKHKKHHKSYKHEYPREEKVQIRPHQLQHERPRQLHKVPFNGEYNAPDFDRVPNFDEGPNFNYAPKYNAPTFDDIVSIKDQFRYVDSTPNFDPVSFYDATRDENNYDDDTDSIEVIDLL